MSDIIDKLSEWRNEDHEDHITLSRHDIVTLLERIKARASDGRYYALEDADREAAIARIERLEAALRFYADYERYDSGRIARAALEPEQEK